jgi:hypothetical protein
VRTTARDEGSPITHVCIIPTRLGAPRANDRCFRSLSALGLTPDQILNRVDIPYLIGFTPGHFTFSIYMKDTVNNVSLPASGTVGADGAQGTDTLALKYDPGQAPVVKNVVVTNKLNHSFPPVSSDLQFAPGENVYIKWHASDDKPFPAQPITITYTTDDAQFNEVTTSITNTVQSGCTGLVANATYSGCIVWKLPSALSQKYFRIRVAAIDDNGLITFSSSTPMNLRSFRTIAGDTDIGTNASASSAILKSRYTAPLYADAQSLVVTNEGTLFFKDVVRGIMRVTPEDGLFKVYVKKTGRSSGDGGSVSDATICDAYKIALDYKDRLLIYDCGSIRRVNADGTIQTLIGGGTLKNPVMKAREMALANNGNNAFWGGMHPLPDGTIVFSDGEIFSACDHVATSATCPESPRGFWRYSESDGMVRRINVTGTGLRISGATSPDDVTKYHFQSFGFSFEPATSKLKTIYGRFAHQYIGGTTFYSGVMSETGAIRSDLYIDAIFNNYFTEYIFPSRNGDLHTLSRNYQTGLYRYDEAQKTWVRLLGKADKSRGHCPDGTAALNCAVDLDDAFVTDQGYVFFLDRGVIRVVDENGLVKTIFGQPLDSGDGGQAGSARFHQVNYIGQGPNGAIVIQDHGTNRYREALSGIIQLIAGNGGDGYPYEGKSALDFPASSSYWGGTTGMFVDKSTGDIYSTGTTTINKSGVLKLNRANGIWERVVGGGTTSWLDADGLAGTSNLGGWAYPMMIHGASADMLFGSSHMWTETDQIRDNMVKLYARSNGAQKHFAGLRQKTGSVALPADGTVMATSDNFGVFDSMGNAEFLNGSWYWFTVGSLRLIEVPQTDAGGGAVKTFLNTANPIQSFALTEVTDAAGAKKKVVYYCAYNGSIYQVDVAANKETLVDFGTPTIKCHGRRLLYDASSKRLYFPFNQNGLHAVGEFQL